MFTVKRRGVCSVERREVTDVCNRRRGREGRTRGGNVENPKLASEAKVGQAA